MADQRLEYSENRIKLFVAEFGLFKIDIMSSEHCNLRRMSDDYSVCAD